MRVANVTSLAARNRRRARAAELVRRHVVVAGGRVVGADRHVGRAPPHQLAELGLRRRARRRAQKARDGREHGGGVGIARVGTMRGRLGHDLLQRGHEQRAAVEALARRQLPQEHAGRVQIAARIRHAARLLLRRDVAARAADHAARVDGRGDAEVDDLDLAVARHQHVRRRQIAVHHAAPVRVVEPAQHLLDYVRGQGRRIGPSAMISDRGGPSTSSSARK